MELAGDEKRIQALFSEVRLDDQRTAPRFEKVLKRAKAIKPELVPGSGRLIIAFASVLIIAAVSALALWTRSVSTPTATLEEAKSLLQIASAASSASAEEPKKLVVNAPVKSRRTIQRRPARQRTIERAMIEDAVMLSSWQSPTEIFMESPASHVLKSLPQLDQSVRELESFLPTNEGKELNQ